MTTRLVFNFCRNCERESYNLFKDGINTICPFCWNDRSLSTFMEFKEIKELPTHEAEKLLSKIKKDVDKTSFKLKKYYEQFKNTKHNIVMLSANRFGLEIAKIVKPDYLITLDQKSNTKMYDLATIEDFKNLNICPVLTVININFDIDVLEGLKPLLLIVAGWRQILSKELLAICPVIGFHPTLLPFGRGPAPILNSILLGIKDSGVTLFYLDESMDGGDIIGQKKFVIDKRDNYYAVYQKVIEKGKELIYEYLEGIINGKAPRIKQKDSEASYFEKRTLDENIIDLKKDSIRIVERRMKAWSHPFEIILE